MGHTHSKELGNKWIVRTRELRRSDKKQKRKEEKEGERETKLKRTKERKVHIRRERKDFVLVYRSVCLSVCAP